MSLCDLWLPITICGITTHILSVVAWMILPHHKPEWNKLPQEEKFQDWLAENEIPAKQYLIPHASNSKQMASESYKQKQGRSNAMLIVWPSAPNMGINIAKTLIFFFGAAAAIAYLSSLSISAGASFTEVFRFVFVAGLLTHCAAKFPGVFWFRRLILMDLVDGVFYALATAAVFASLWP